MVFLLAYDWSLSGNGGGTGAFKVPGLRFLPHHASRITRPIRVSKIREKANEFAKIKANQA
jgi:hypothetical protein